MKIVFFGSEEFAATSLGKLIEQGHQIVGVVTPPDRPRDRMKVTFLPVKMIAREHLFPLFQPEDVLDQTFLNELKALEADVFIVIAYGKILPQIILDIPKHFCINVHASLLPKYRGPAPINWAILNGDMRTGVTVMKMNERMDAGEMIAQEAVDVSEEIDAQTLREKLADVGASCLCGVLKAMEEGEASFIPQDEQAATYAPKLTKELGQIDWTRSAQEIHNQVRGLVPWPGAFTFFQNKRVKVLEAACFDHGPAAAGAGEVIKLLPQGLVVACGQGQLLLKQVQPESSKAMDARSFSVGHRVSAGARFEHNGKKP